MSAMGYLAITSSYISSDGYFIADLNIVSQDSLMELPTYSTSALARALIGKHCGGMLLEVMPHQEPTVLRMFKKR